MTFNLAHFPADRLEPLGIEAQHPDEFIAHLIDLEPGAVCVAARRQRASLKNPPKSVDEFLDALSRQGLAETVSRLTGRSTCRTSGSSLRYSRHN